ncbi:MAG: DUF3791 domain-containing protein [Elusimicrobiota bacterium]|jgi:hypothetical protein|nr:DUF3791 domain-containing protein [Elusimicrobiota bacterium]
MNSKFQGKPMYIVMCINEFAHRKNLTQKDSFSYLQKFGALNFLDEFYDIEHTLPFDDTIETLTDICRRTGGYI